MKLTPTELLKNGGASYHRCYNCNLCNQHIYWHHQHIEETPINYDIVYVSNGGLGTMDSTSFIYNKAGYLSENAYQKYGMDFVGWDTNKSGTTVVYEDKAEI